MWLESNIGERGDCRRGMPFRWLGLAKINTHLPILLLPFLRTGLYILQNKNIRIDERYKTAVPEWEN
jgi:hypothetical protein